MSDNKSSSQVVSRDLEHPTGAPVATGGTRPAGGGRLLWADCAKGLSIVAVCYMHVITGAPGGQDSPWQWFNMVMDPIRMPMFFLISGLFAHRVISRTLGDLWYRRLWFLLVPYLVFTPVQAAIRIDMIEDVTWRNLTRAILLGDPGIWFLYALMVFNILACLLRRIPPLAAVALSVVPALCVAAAGLAQYPEITHITAYMPAFFLGLHLRHLYFRLSAAATDWRVILGAVGAYISWEWLVDVLYDRVFEGGISTDEAAVMSLVVLMRTLTAVPLGILIATWISYTPGLSTIFAGIGRHTLPIYVSHQAALHLVNAIIITALIDGNPERWDFLNGMNIRIAIGFLTCVASGYLFYGIGKIPVLKWVLYPPALPRHRPRRRSG
ncbi:acyltransferase family protein [Corynebacterium terpenotabidum]|uniref:Acyltransferase 3 domain-containing protein n=1 Tax=Corynebacterium terpenotabidum Y-11 TaxID=1200352 RepID=S4XDG2_9CORY|nr:acyltransferase family protein [Corynebacterium terpenotabidum]AGP30564.1 hypothetical protein A606_04575 [Corynebacterium terpenotabidum Y-11]